MPFPHARMFPLESPVMVFPFSANVTHSTNLGFSCFWGKTQETCLIQCDLLRVHQHSMSSQPQAAMTELAPTNHELWRFGIDLTFGKQSGGASPQTAPASWPACLSPGSRNTDETCHMSLWRCSLSGGSPHQTPTRWSTEGRGNAVATRVHAGFF